MDREQKVRKCQQMNCQVRNEEPGDFFCYSNLHPCGQEGKRSFQSFINTANKQRVSQTQHRSEEWKILFKADNSCTITLSKFTLNSYRKNLILIIKILNIFKEKYIYLDTYLFCFYLQSPQLLLPVITLHTKIILGCNFPTIRGSYQCRPKNN